MTFNKLSQKFVFKFFDDTFKDVSDKPWYSTFYSYIIDSKYRLSKRLDYFLKEQVGYPKPELQATSWALRENCTSSSGTVDFDKLIIDILEYVEDRITYQIDKTNYGKVEYWADAYEVWKRRKDDCDGMNSLIYVLARLAGITELVLWSCIGSTGSGGHYWNIYFSTKTGKWYAIDSTYYPNFTHISDHRSSFKFSEHRYKDLWYCFNEQHILKQR